VKTQMPPEGGTCGKPLRFAIVELHTTTGQSSTFKTPPSSSCRQGARSRGGFRVPARQKSPENAKIWALSYPPTTQSGDEVTPSGHTGSPSTAGLMVTGKGGVGYA